MVFPVWPTWCWWPIQLESTADRDAPTAERGMSAEISRRSSKFSGPFMPRPPEMTTSASLTSISPPLSWRTSVTSARAAAGGISTASLMISPAAAAGTAGKTLGLRETTWGEEVSRKAKRALPAKIGRVNSKLPSWTDIRVQSAASPTPSRAASRGARSLPIAVAEKKTAAGLSFFTRPARAAA